jgi:hypothetical protein
MAAVFKWAHEVRQDAARLQRIEDKAVKWFVNMQTDFAWTFVDEQDEGRD